uniref:Uncharacterized protein n=1 Tax=Anopheles stephensi TaxID=30069 RepID=A0A182YGP9_ANOST
MLFINRWFLSLLVALVVLDGGVQAFRYYKRMGNRFRPVIMKPMPVGRFGFVRAENPNADGAMDAKSGEESSDVAPQAPAMDGLPMHDMHEPQMREMIHDSPHPVEIDMGPEMQSRVMGFEGELDEGNFGRAAGDEGEDKEEEEGGQFRHFKHKKHKKHKYVIHTHHHYHHKKGGEGYGHHGYGHGHHGGYGHGHHGGYGGHHHGGGGHGYGHGDEGDEGDDYEPTYGHHGRYRRSSSMSESSPAQELASDGGPQALDRTVLHSSPDHPIPLVAVATTDPGTPGSPAYRQSVSRRQLVRSKNERLARIGRDRAQRANRYADPQQDHDSDGPCPAEYVEAVGEVVGSAQGREDPKVGSSKRPLRPFQTIINRMFRRPQKQEPVVAADPQKPADPQTLALREEIGKRIESQSSKPNIAAEMKQYLQTKKGPIVGGPKASDGLEAPDVSSTAGCATAPLPGTFLPELGTIVSVRFVDEAGRERSVPFELTSRHLGGNGTAHNLTTTVPLNYNFFYFHCLTPGGAPARLRSMAKRMIEGLEGGGRSGRATGEDESGAAGEGSVPQRWAHRRRTKSEWRRRDANAGRRRRPMPVEKVIERRTPEELPLPVTPPPVITVDPVEPVVEEREVEREQEEDPGCDDPICSNFYVDERKLTTTSTTPREPEHRLEEELEPKLVPLGNEIDEEEGEEAPVGTFVAQPREEPKSTRNSLWRGLSKRLSAFRERQADRVARRRMIIVPEQSSTTTAGPMPMDDDGYDSNEIVEYYQQQDVGRVLYRMANGRLLEEPQRLHLRRSAEGADEEGDSNSLRKRRLNRLSNRMNRRRKPTKSNAASEAQPAEGASDKSRTPMINIGTFRLTDPKYDGAGSAPVPAATGGVENTGAARSVSGTVPADMDNYIMQKVREYCSTSCAAGKAQPPPVIIMPSAPVVPVSNSEPIVGSSRQLIVQPASTYEDAPVAPATARTSAPNPPASCPTKIVKCIPKALADRSGSKRYRKTESSPQPSSDDLAEDKESNPLVSLARGMRHYRFNPFRRLFGPFARL